MKFARIRGHAGTWRLDNVPSLISVFAVCRIWYSGAAASIEDVLKNVTHRTAGRADHVDVLTVAKGLWPSSSASLIGHRTHPGSATPPADVWFLSTTLPSAASLLGPSFDGLSERLFERATKFASLIQLASTCTRAGRANGRASGLTNSMSL
jgi:hypothetical protein